MSDLSARVVRLLGKPPSYVLRRVALEMRAQLDRVTLPRRARSFDVATLLARTGEASLEVLWGELADQPWPIPTARLEPAQLDAIAPRAVATIMERAEKACRHEADLLGSGPTSLGAQIVWDVDFKTGDRWPPRYFRDIALVDAARPSDVKVPWELSRLQWLLPVGQAYLLTGEERFAAVARDVLEQWIRANPVGQTVNWAIAMEPAMRVFGWVWLFRVFAHSQSWSDPGFEARFLCCAYQHAAFIARFIERSDLNGNHFTADCAALVIAGSFFGGQEARGWLAQGWGDLEHEIGIQILEDGVDLEASSAYHRLVSELFLLGAIHATHRGLDVSERYRQRLEAAARFSAAYTRPDGTAPLWGDADDARALPFGVAAVNDHRHLIACVGAYLQDEVLGSLANGGREEVFWLLGAAHAAGEPPQRRAPASEAFPAGGAYVLQAALGHVFVDCGPVGFGGRGGHGHNDALSFEAALTGLNVVCDAGCYVYTASIAERNYFRSTAAHNTPQLDDAEINRFVSPEHLWSLRDDAHPVAPQIVGESDHVVFEGGHTGYQRLSDPVIPWRRIALRRDGAALSVTDTFKGRGVHTIRVPLQLAPDWSVCKPSASEFLCTHASGSRMRIDWHGELAWDVSVHTGRVAPSYGVVVDAPRIEWRTSGSIEQIWLKVSMEMRAQREES